MCGDCCTGPEITSWSRLQTQEEGLGCADLGLALSTLWLGATGERRGEEKEKAWTPWQPSQVLGEAPDEGTESARFQMGTLPARIWGGAGGGLGVAGSRLGPGQRRGEGLAVGKARILQVAKQREATEGSAGAQGWRGCTRACGLQKLRTEVSSCASLECLHS